VKYVDEYRRPEALQALARSVREMGVKGARVMEVCGTHTMAAARFGLRGLLGDAATLSSGPGCPVCVTAQSDIDLFLEMGRLPQVTLASFGDMLRVPGTRSSLERERARGAQVEVVYSPMDALALAQHGDRQVVFFAVGFETTAPGVAVTLMEARRRSVGNFSVLCAHKTMPAALEKLASSKLKLDGLMLPGHVSTIIGAKAYEFLPERHGIACVVSGFEPTDMLQSVKMLLEQVIAGKKRVDVQYSRAVSRDGNRAAQQIMGTVFEPCDVEWRGLGVIHGSGLRLKEEWADLDARSRFQVAVPRSREPPGCRCGQVLAGEAEPPDCELFGNACTPEHPVGACMVSSEGTCAAWYRYRQ